jgi:hypothetical protein
MGGKYMSPQASRQRISFIVSFRAGKIPFAFRYRTMTVLTGFFDEMMRSGKV